MYSLHSNIVSGILTVLFFVTALNNIYSTLYSYCSPTQPLHVHLNQLTLIGLRKHPQSISAVCTWTAELQNEIPL